MKNAPQTFAELMRGRRWRIICRLFKRTNTTLDLAASEEEMGQYSKVVLDGDGFKIVTDKASLQAAFTAGPDPKSRPVTLSEEVLELVLACDGSLSEAGTIATIVQKVDELQSVEV